MSAPPSAIREIGIPIRGVNWARLHVGRDKAGRPAVYATMGQQGDNLFVLQIDPDTGRCRQFLSRVPGSNYPVCAHVARDGRLYVGAAYAGHLLRFDPDREALDDLGPIHEGAATFPCQIDEDAESRIWIGSYPGCDLTCYDPAPGHFAHHGRMDETDMYCYPQVGADGTIACMVRMTRPHVVVLDPRTGRKETVGPVVGPGHHTLGLARRKDGRLYINSVAGDFRVEGFEAAVVSSLPDPADPPALADGRTFAFVDDAEISRTLELRHPDGGARRLQLDYDVAGTDIFCLHVGPDGKLYGSSVLPEHLFRYDPAAGELADLGRCSVSNGEAYSMTNFGRDLYIASYPAARLSVYDPSRPYHFGEQPEDNPRDLGRMDEVSYRPRSMLAGPRGRVWTASLPDYGMWGGPLSCYDPATGEKKSYPIAGEASCYTLAHAEGFKVLAVGTTVQGGSGARPKAVQADLLLWDYHAEKVVWRGTLDPAVTAYNALTTGGYGRVYGTALQGEGRSEVFVFDLSGPIFRHRARVPAGRPLDNGIQIAPDGRLYGVTSECIYRCEAMLDDVEVLVEFDDEATVSGPILDGHLYFAAGHRLMAARIC